MKRSWEEEELGGWGSPCEPLEVWPSRDRHGPKGMAVMDMPRPWPRWPKFDGGLVQSLSVVEATAMSFNAQYDRERPGQPPGL